MRIAKVLGTVTLNRALPSLGVRHGRFLIAEAMDHQALAGNGRATPMPQSLIVFDELGAGVGQVIAVSEGAEAAQPFRPASVPYDAYNAAILDHVEVDPNVTKH